MSREPIDLLRLSGTKSRPQLISQEESNEEIEFDEEIELDDLTQLKVVNHKLEVDILCDSIRKYENLLGFKKLHFEKLNRDEKMKIEEAM